MATQPRSPNSKISTTESPSWNPALKKLREHLDDSRESADDGDRISVIVEPPKRSLRPPARAAVAILSLLPPWGRVVVLAAAIAAAAAGYALDWW